MRKRKVVGILTLLFFMLACCNPIGLASPMSDIAGHWAEASIVKMVDQGIISGYPDGTFKPEGKITRAEFASLLVRGFQLPIGGSKVFSDTANHWAKDFIAAAYSQGIISGYSEYEFGPDDPITREQMAVMIVKAARPDADVEGKTFADNNSIADWARQAVIIATGNNIISGYPDNTFRPKSNTTRAEAAVVLNQTLSLKTPIDETPTIPEEDYSVIDEDGIYGPYTGTETVEGSVTIESPDVTLRNLIITGNLIIAEEVGDGDVTLDNVTVKGKTYIRGGGKDSIYINGGQYNEVIVEKIATKAVRIVAEDVKGLKITIAKEAAGKEIILKGDIDFVSVRADDIKVTTQADTNINEIRVQSGLDDVDIYLDEGTIVDEMVLYSAVAVQGKGKIKEASGSKVTDSTFATKPDKIATGGGGGGGGGGGTPSTPATTADVGTLAALTNAIGNSNIKTINFTADITGNVTVNRLVNINFGGFKLDGNLTINTDSNGTITLTGTANPAITGNLTVDARNATVNNGVKVQGTIIIKDVASGTWIENASGNSIQIQDQTATITINGSVQSIQVEQGSQNTLTITVSQNGKVETFVANAGAKLVIEGTVANATINAPITVTGGAKIEKAEINAEVVVDASPAEVTKGADKILIQAVGTAAAKAGEKKITYTLTTGTFDATNGTDVENWTIAGANGAELGAITQVTLSGENKVATITVTNAIEAGKNYTVIPAKAALAAGFAAPTAATVTITPAPSATVGSVTISGTVNQEIADQDVVITLANDTFKEIAKDAVLASWITNLPTGLTAKAKEAVSAGATSVTIVVAGTPTVTKTEAIAITIPADQLNSGKALTVTTNAEAKFDIKEDQSGAVIANPTSITVGEALSLNVTEAKGIDGTSLTGEKQVTVTSDKDGEVFNSTVNFTNGTATIEIGTSKLNTEDTHTLTVTIEGVTKPINVTVEVQTA